MKKSFLLLGISLISNFYFAQGSPDYGDGLKVKLNEDGSKYFRVIAWAQGQANYTDAAAANEEKTTFQLRRARVLMYAQISPKFMVLTHFGLNSLGASTMSPTGKGDGSQIFMHDAWAQYNITKSITLGAGLHYFNGISRLNSQGTLNIMTLDNNRESWSTLGLSDQFARHVGIFGKGNFGKLQYQVSVNESITNGLDARTPEEGGAAVYGGKRLLGKDAGKNFTGYFAYNFLDMESNLLPFKVGSYLGTKKVFNIGAGFFADPKGAVIMENNELKGENVNLFAVDAFYDSPIGDNGSAITAYASYQNNDYGKNYLYNVYGTGSMIYAHVGYVLPGDKTKTRFQPYVLYDHFSYDATSDKKNRMGIGANAYFSGHNSKLTVEYAHQKFGEKKTNTVSVQAMVYL